MKKYCFVDMHIHSIFSNEEGVFQTPGQILNNIYDMVQEERAKDHEKILNMLAHMSLENVHRKLADYYMLETKEELDLLWECLQGNDVGVICDKVTKNFVKACISITDHNSILGSTEAVRIMGLYPEKYSCVKQSYNIEDGLIFSDEESGVNNFGVDEF